MSRGLYGTYALLSFNSRLAQRQVNKRCIEIIKECVKAWVRSATESTNNIPVWSGMARGAIKKVGDLVGQQVSIIPAPGAMPPKGPGNRTNLGVLQSEARLITLPGRYGFEWKSGVDHLKYNDENDATDVGFNLTHTPRPWEFKSNADAEFRRELAAQLRKDPIGELARANLKVTLRDIG